MHVCMCQGVECVGVCVYVYMLATGYLFIQSFPTHCTGTNSLSICLQFPDKPDVLSNGQIMPPQNVFWCGVHTLQALCLQVIELAHGNGPNHFKDRVDAEEMKSLDLGDPCLSPPILNEDLRRQLMLAAPSLMPEQPHCPQLWVRKSAAGKTAQHADVLGVPWTGSIGKLRG